MNNQERAFAALRALLLGACCLLVARLAPAQPAAPAAPTSSPPAPPLIGELGNDLGLSALNFLVGDWDGTGGGAPGQGTGSFSFHYDLQQKILVRRNSSVYPATPAATAAKNRAASTHDDLMVIYSERERQPLRAIYFDSEGHIIQYRVLQAPKGTPAAPGVATFLSVPTPRNPMFRLTYRLTAPDTLEIKFEIARPESPDAFSLYLTGTAKRKPAN